MLKARIDAKQAVEDIRSGMDDAALMKKYGVSAKGLESLLKKLVTAGVLTSAEYEKRMERPEATIDIDFASFRLAVEDDKESVALEPVRKRVLVISHGSDSFAVLQGVLSRDNLYVVKLAAGPSAAEVLGEMRPDVVIADVASSPIPYLTLLRTVNDFDPCVPVILLTDRDDREESYARLEQGAYDFIEKPLSRKSVTSVVSRALEHADLLRLRRNHKKLMEEAIHEKTMEIVRTKDFLKGILNSSSLVSVVLTDLDQNVLFWNKGAENIFGYTADEMIGTKVTRLYPRDALTKETVDQLRDMVKRGSGSVLGKMKQLSKDGRVLTMSLSISPMLDSFGELKGILGIGLDVTEEVRQHREIVHLLNQVKKTQDVSIFTLAKLAESRDEETGLHLTRIQRYCKVLCRGLAEKEHLRNVVTKKFSEELYHSCVLHDIGKVAIPDAVLMSTGKFTEEEREIMKKHPVVGGQALEEAVKALGERSFLTTGMEVAYYHHERWDGNGYPFGLKGEAIPLSARIVSIADVYDALTSARRYKKAFTHEEACRIITEAKGTQFDPEIVDAFQDLESEFRTIRSTFS